MISPEVLRRFSFFVMSGEHALKSVAMMANEINLEPGQVLFDDGDDADHLYVVTAGEVDVVQIMGEDNEVTVCSVVAGELLGWSALSDNRVRRSKCVATRDSRLVQIDGPELHQICTEDPLVGYQIMRAINATMERRLTGAWIQLAAEAV